MADTVLADARAFGRRGQAPTAPDDESARMAAGASAAAGARGPQRPRGHRRGGAGRRRARPLVVARATGSPLLEGSVKEPTEFYRHRAEIRHGLGGDAEGSGFTEPAVEQGLRFFTRIQFPDGHWSLDRLPEGVKLDDAALAARRQADTAATGLVLLTYLGAGYTHLDEKHRDVVRRGIEWLVKHQKPDGDLFAGGSQFTHFYSHGMAAMALCEAYGMTQDPELREPARKAVAFIVATQDPRRGGWRYGSGSGPQRHLGDRLAVDGAAQRQMAGLEVPQATLDRVGGWLDQAAGRRARRPLRLQPLQRRREPASATSARPAWP